MICGPAILAATLMLADFYQTQQIASQYPRYKETNPILGERPSTFGVTAHFAITAGGLSLLSGKATCNQQRALWSTVAAVEGFYVLSNHRLLNGHKSWLD